MQTVPWIIDNMILENKENNKLRRPSEIELKVQKSLQQLTIPDWYINKCRASPKIITDRRPIETRPAPWKDSARNRGSSINSSGKNAQGNTAVVRPVVNENKISSSEREELNGLIEIGVKPSLSISKTFPKISPSRKIQNINIVFPTTAEPSSEKTLDESENDKETREKDTGDKSLFSIDSLDQFTPQKMSSLKNQPTTRIPTKDSAARTLDFENTPEKKSNRINCRNSVVSESRPSIHKSDYFNFRDENILKEASFSSPKRLDDIEKILIGSASKNLNEEFSTPVKTGKIPRMNSSQSNVSFKNRSDFFEQSFDEEKLFSTPKKSTEMENIIKNEQKRSNNKSFVEEIIQELNAKCSPKVKSNYVSPTSKNFVKKLVRALEMGCVPIKNEEGNNSDVDSKSGPSSASISIKDSDSGSGSDSESKLSISPSCSSDSPFRNFSRALENHGKVTRETVAPYVDDEDESVYWIPLPTCKLPRTSSLKNMMARLSSHGGSSSPTSTVSDISRDPQSSWQRTNLQYSDNAFSGWGRTFDKKQIRSRQLFRIDETTVIDSGYSDRSGTNSSSSSVVDESWYADSETTQTASEQGDDFESIYSNHLQRFRPSHRYTQRTSAI